MDYLKVIDMQLWSELFGICLMFGIDEDVYKANYEALFYEETYKEIRIRKKQLKADAVAGGIPYKSIEGEFYYEPRKLIEWAIFRGLPVPDDFRLGLDNFKQISDIVRLEIEKHEPQAETVASDCGDSHAANDPAKINNGVNKQRTRKTNLSRAVEAAVKTFSQKPSFDELWKYFQDDKDTTDFIQDYTDTHIIWIDTRGRLHDTQKETLANHLSRVKS